MKQGNFVGSATLGAVSIFMYLCLNVVEQLSKNFFEAYMTASQVSYSSDMFSLDFSSLKIILIIMAAIFFALAVISLFCKENKK